MGLTQVATAVAAICFSLAEAVNGPTGANNDTTPTATDGDITIHYVTVGKVENAFQVDTSRRDLMHTMLRMHRSLIASMPELGTLSASNSTQPTTLSSDLSSAIPAFPVRIFRSTLLRNSFLDSSLFQIIFQM